jgi:hypothetical protein
MQLFFSLKHETSTDSLPHHYTGNIFVKINTVIWFQGDIFSSVGGGKRINHRIAAIHCQSSSHDVVSNTPHHERD